MDTHRSLAFAAALLALPTAARAQRIVADISIRQGPVSGHVVIGHPYPAWPRSYSEAGLRYHRYPASRVLVVDRGSHGRGWYHRRGYRAVRVWYDAGHDRYYDRYDERGGGLREVVVYEWEGRYYRDEARNDYRGRVGGHREDRRFEDRDDDDYQDRR